MSRCRKAFQSALMPVPIGLYLVGIRFNSGPDLAQSGVEPSRIRFAPEHVLDPAVLAHLQSGERAGRPEHGVACEPLLHPHHHRRGAEHLAAAHTAEWLVLIESSGASAGLPIEEIALAAGDAGFRTRVLAQPALHAVHLDEREAGLVSAGLQGRHRTYGHACHAQGAGLAVGLDPTVRGVGRQIGDVGTAAARDRGGGRARVGCRCASRRMARTSPAAARRAATPSPDRGRPRAPGRPRRSRAARVRTPSTRGWRG